MWYPPPPSSILFLKDLSEFGNLLFFSCEFVLQAPQGTRYCDILIKRSSKTIFCRFTNDDTRIPAGLINQGATCYMNAALQILFSTKSLRKANCCVQRTHVLYSF